MLLNHSKPQFYLYLIGFYLFGMMLFFGCKDKKEEKPSYDMAKQALIDEDTIKAYLSRNQINNAIRTSSGLYYRILLSKPDAARSDSGKIVEVFYTGKLTDNRVFDSNNTQNSAFAFKVGIGNVIKGWDLGIPYFRLGERGQLFIPSTLGYKNQASGRIPPNSVLIFDIEIYRVR